MNFLARVTTLGCFAVFLLAGCKNQGIGERCTPNVIGDCEQNLACVQGGTGYGVCCPTNNLSCAPNPPETTDAAGPDASDGNGEPGEDGSSDDGSTGDTGAPDGAAR
jgi:hypothetical protein